MSLLDDFIQGFIRPWRRLAAPFILLIEFLEGEADPDDQGADRVGQAIADSTPADDVAAAIVDIVEESILADLEDAGELTPENVEQITDQTEGAATAVLLGLGLSSSAIELATAGQVDQQQEYITQALAGLGVDEVTGLELDARIEEGIQPALLAKVAKEHRSQFVNLQDAVEYALRTKDNDDEYLTLSGASPEARDKVGSVDQVSPDNLLEEWGIRDDNLDILELVALETMEFEELIETPAELGLIVPDDVLDLTLDLAGYPEPLKDFLRQIPDEIPRSNRAWEERTAVEALVDELEPLVRDGEISPDDAVDLIPDEVDVAKPALQDRFEGLQSPPPGAPTRSLIENSGTLGFSSIDDLEERLERLEYNIDRYDDVVDVTLFNELDGNLQTAFALGLIDDDRYGDIMDRLGLDSEAQAGLMSGQSLSDIVQARLEEEADPADLPISSISGIGQSRAAGLRAAGIETVEDLAGADVQDVMQAAQVESETAQGFIDQAVLRTQ